MTHHIIGRIAKNQSIEPCVSELLELGVSKDAISLVTRGAEGIEADPSGIGVFQKNGDVTGQASSSLVGGVLGTLIGTIVGAAYFTLPGVGLIYGAGWLISAMTGGAIGSAVGNTMGKDLDTPNTTIVLLQPVLSALNDGDILFGVEVTTGSHADIKNVITKSAISVLELDVPGPGAAAVM